MATKKEKRLDHIQVKDNGVKLANKVGDNLSDASNSYQNKIFEDLLKNSNL